MVKWRNRTTRNNLFISENEGREIALYDIETTGFNAQKDKIIQFSGIKFVIKDGKPENIASINEYINPEMPIPPKITEITGINDSMVFDKMTEKELFPKIKDFFGKPDIVVSGYNVAKFDNNFMKSLFQRQDDEFRFSFTIDVLEMARDNIEKTDSKSFKLGDVAAMFHADEGLTFHNAFDDITATQRLLLIFLQKYHETYEEDENFSENGPTPNAELKQVTAVYSLRFWEGFKGNSRIYVETNIGGFYYDVRKHLWQVNPKNNPYDVKEVDMELLRYKVFEKCKVEDEYEFVKCFSKKNLPNGENITVITSMNYWEKEPVDGGRAYHRIYVNTDKGEYFYDIDFGTWKSKIINKIPNTELLEKLCFEKANVSNYDDLVVFVKSK